MKAFFRLVQSPVFLEDSGLDYDAGEISLTICLTLKDEEDWEAFQEEIFDFSSKVEERHGIHDSRGGRQTFLNHKDVEYVEFNSYEIGDFMACSKMWLDFFKGSGKIAKDEDWAFE